MKVREILEVIQVPETELLTKLENVGITADLETDIANDIVKKLSKVYKIDIRAEARKMVAAKEKPAQEEKEEAAPQKEKPREKAKEEDKPQTKAKPAGKPKTKKPADAKKAEQEKSKPAAAKKGQPAKPRTPKKEDMPTEREEPEIELTRVYDDKYTEYEKEARVHVRLKNVKKRAKK
ncbi:MAG: hypothetical protein WCZ85_07270, partial [Bacilli bacterium]